MIISDADVESINHAFIRMSRRAESVDREKLVQTFVDIGPLFNVLSSDDHQIVYGRRGTGKTHALIYVTEQAKKSIPVYVDLRNIGSSGGLYGDTNIPIAQRATRLLLDVLGDVHEVLLRYSLEKELNLAEVGPLLDSFGDAITEVEVVGEVERELTQKDSAKTTTSSALNATFSKEPSLGASMTDSFTVLKEGEARIKESGSTRYRVHFGRIGRALQNLVTALKLRLLIVMDEWSVIPLELQPYLADFVRRAIFPLVGVTVKIAAIEQRSHFKLPAEKGDYTGIEIGADASADVDLDDYMVFDNNAERATQFFKELLFRHYVSDEESGPRFANADELIAAAFTQRNAFDDFVRAAEGVPRDAINVLSVAAQRSLRERISIPTIRVAARTWYQRDKEAAIRSNQDAQDLLHWIIFEVIAHRRARAFLLRSNVRYPLIDTLFDARLLHVIKRSISSQTEPGVRYDAFKLDYGCYVDLLTTGKAPEQLFQLDEPSDAAAGIDVPPDDYRAIRRAILDFHDFEIRPKLGIAAPKPAAS